MTSIAKTLALAAFAAGSLFAQSVSAGCHTGRCVTPVHGPQPGYATQADLYRAYQILCRNPHLCHKYPDLAIGLQRKFGPIPGINAAAPSANLPAPSGAPSAGPSPIAPPLNPAPPSVSGPAVSGQASENRGPDGPAPTPGPAPAPSPNAVAPQDGPASVLPPAGPQSAPPSTTPRPDDSALPPTVPTSQADSFPADLPTDADPAIN